MKNTDVLPTNGGLRIQKVVRDENTTSGLTLGAGVAQSFSKTHQLILSMENSPLKMVASRRGALRWHSSMSP